MPVSAETLRVLMAKGLMGDDLIDVVAAFDADCSAGMSGGIPVDTTAEKRRAYDRERKSRQRLSGGKSGGIPPEHEPRAEPLPVEVNQSNLANSSPPIVPPQRNSTGTPKAKRLGTRLAEDWKPSEADRSYALVLGMTEKQLDRTVEKFRNYWLAKPGAAGTKLDWAATWRNWSISEAERLGCSPRPEVPVAIHGYYALRGSPQWEAWENYTRETKGRSPPCDARGGWHFPSEWPPPTTASA